MAYDGDENNFTDANHATVIIRDNRLYSHKVLRINYTAYDVCRAQDTINPSTPRRYVMLTAHNDQQSQDSHPFWYAQVLGIFHAWVVHSGPHSKSLVPQKVDFLWIRWFGVEPGHRTGWKALRLDHVGFVGDKEGSPNFGFLDPANVLCAAHLIPAFAYGRTTVFLGPSLIRENQDEEDWESFYVNRCLYSSSTLFCFVLTSPRFVDRDMFMRYFGAGVGHLGQNPSRIHWQASGSRGDTGCTAANRTASPRPTQLGPDSDSETPNNDFMAADSPDVPVDEDEELDTDADNNDLESVDEDDDF